jgi:hypothetical protein
MRRILALGALALLVMVTAGACRGDSAPTPTVPSVDFTPKATIAVDDSSPLTVDIGGGGGDLASGSVLLVTNAGHSDHRLVGTIDTTQVFDSGTLEPGNETTIVVGSDGELHIADLTTDREVTVTVTPRTDP